jgi:hypothetical protein
MNTKDYAKLIAGLLRGNFKQAAAEIGLESGLEHMGLPNTTTLSAGANYATESIASTLQPAARFVDRIAGNAYVQYGGQLTLGFLQTVGGLVSQYAPTIPQAQVPEEVDALQGDFDAFYEAQPAPPTLTESFIGIAKQITPENMERIFSTLQEPSQPNHFREFCIEFYKAYHNTDLSPPSRDDAKLKDIIHDPHPETDPLYTLKLIRAMRLDIDEINSKSCLPLLKNIMGALPTSIASKLTGIGPLSDLIKLLCRIPDEQIIELLKFTNKTEADNAKIDQIVLALSEKDYYKLATTFQDPNAAYTTDFEQLFGFPLPVVDERCNVNSLKIDIDADLKNYYGIAHIILGSNVAISQLADTSIADPIKYFIPEKYRSGFRGISQSLNAEQINQLFNIIGAVKGLQSADYGNQEDISYYLKIILNNAINLQKQGLTSHILTFYESMFDNTPELEQVFKLSEKLTEESVGSMCDRIARIFSIAQVIKEPLPLGGTVVDVNPEDSESSTKEAITATEKIGLEATSQVFPACIGMIVLEVLSIISHTPKSSDMSVSDIMSVLQTHIPHKIIKDAIGMADFLIEESYISNHIPGNTVLQKISSEDTRALGRCIQGLVNSIDQLSSTEASVQATSVQKLFKSLSELNTIGAEKLDPILAHASNVIRPELPIKKWLTYIKGAIPLLRHLDNMTDDHYTQIAEFINKIPHVDDTTLLTLNACSLLKSLPNALFSDPQAIEALFALITSDINQSDINPIMRKINAIMSQFATNGQSGVAVLTGALSRIQPDTFSHLEEAYKAWIDPDYNAEDKNDTALSDTLKKTQQKTIQTKIAACSDDATVLLDTLGNALPILNKGSGFRNMIDAALVVNQHHGKIDALTESISELSERQTVGVKAAALNEPINNMIEALKAFNDIPNDKMEQVLEQAQTLGQITFHETTVDALIRAKGLLPKLNELEQRHIDEICKVIELVNEAEKDTTLVTLKAMQMLKSLPDSLKSDPNQLKGLMQLLSSPINSSDALRVNTQGINWITGLFTTTDTDGYQVLIDTLNEVEENVFENLATVWTTYHKDEEEFEEVDRKVLRLLADVKPHDVNILLQTVARVCTPLKAPPAVIVGGLVFNKLLNFDLEGSDYSAEIKPLIDELTNLDAEGSTTWKRFADNLLESGRDGVNLIQRISKIKLHETATYVESDWFAKFLQVTLLYAKCGAGTQDLIKSLSQVLEENDEYLLSKGKVCAKYLNEIEKKLISTNAFNKTYINNCISPPPSWWSIFKSVSKWLLNTFLYDKNLQLIRTMSSIFGAGFVISFMALVMTASATASIAATAFALLSGGFLALAIIVFLIIIVYDIYKTIQVKQTYDAVQTFNTEMIAGINPNLTSAINKKLNEYDIQVENYRTKVTRELNEKRPPLTKSEVDKQLGEKVKKFKEKYSKFYYLHDLIRNSEHQGHKGHNPAIAIYALLQVTDPKISDLQQLNDDQKEFYQKCKKRCATITEKINKTTFNPNVFLPSIIDQVIQFFPKGKGLTGELSLSDFVKDLGFTQLLHPYAPSTSLKNGRDIASSQAPDDGSMGGAGPPKP